MSAKNHEAQRTARQRLAAEREKQKAAERRRRTLIVGVTVVCVLALATVIGLIAANAGKKGTTSSGPVVAPSGAQGKDSLAIPVGEDGAGATLTVWEDFRCPACQGFERVYRPVIHDLTAAGKLRVEYHLVRLIDHNVGGTGSLRAANAAACAQDAGKFPAYHDVLFDDQPKETEDAFASNDKLIQLAAKVPGLDTPAFRSCVNDGTHDAWVDRSHQAFQDGRFSGTPTVLLGGKNIAQDASLTPEKFRQMVEKEAAGR
ncbi:thioredoxin domain-containing protein [Streptomyces sp. WAC00469]|uniref:DsbA family protein n=1 Tax=Streptomyces sp. WAC00469 TaxID=2487415 RepID=UPI000F7460CC|nr:thioredoxin domain-containing protein [Streptomyces sp. WAC00469]RSS05202.1 hypothetical protein EF917_10135 [Streptomyces sp. WAC00469]